MRVPKFAPRLSRVLFGTKKRILLSVAASLVVIGLFAIGGIYRYITTGGMIARQDPSPFETFIATRLVNLSIPGTAEAMKNPLSASGDGADVANGRDLYQKNCESCHGYDGSGRTASGSGLYPPPANLAGPATAKRTDGALFYLIRNGVRNTGMPGWQFTDQQTWQLVLFVRNLPVVASTDPPPSSHRASAQYVGSAACGTCHAGVYQRWKATRMANVVRDPHEHPDAIIPDLSKSDPLVTFAATDIAFAYGGKWKQRYFKKVGNDYYPLPAQWDVTHKKWRPYFVKDDWWVRYYPADNFKRPTSTTCDGCHSVNYNTTTHMVTEWNVGCEKCHGPGSEHVKNPVNSTIINPARLDYVQANDTCIQCHSQGRPPANPIAGQYYDWPVGFHMGLKLSDFWKLEDHKAGETTFTHFADGTAHKNRMQGNDFVTSLMYTHGVSCFTCHDSHGSGNEALLRKPANSICLDCHSPKSPNGPRAATLEQHTHHKPGSTGSECVACHMPKIAQTLGDVNVRSHTFRFIGPAKTDALKIPNACNVCHTDKSTVWTADALKSWTDRSPWRMEQ
ncbi:MAG: doubled domain protein [Phycisphaerales bacterium]|nr:doubled domain protein [Phycisphaerales bacterium]